MLEPIDRKPQFDTSALVKKVKETLASKLGGIRFRCRDYSAPQRFLVSTRAQIPSTQEGSPK